MYTDKRIFIKNKETLDSFKEAEDIKSNPDKYKSYDDVDEMFIDILIDR